MEERKINKGGQNPQNRSKQRPAAPKGSGGKQKSFHGFGNCQVCGTPLCTPGGCADTGMCGPCCTGEADTAGEY